jgi:3-oxoacyl-[acyl-carrier-protein] synthase-1
MKLHLNALGVVNPLGRGKREVARALFNGSRAGLMQRADFLPDRSVRVGIVLARLPEVPKRFARFDCRNNRLALAALDEIEEDVARIAERLGSHRVAVVMGTSTSGIADGSAHRNW